MNGFQCITFLLCLKEIRKRTQKKSGQQTKVLTSKYKFNCNPSLSFPKDGQWGKKLSFYIPFVPAGFI
jgi:hypothetical protein